MTEVLSTKHPDVLDMPQWRGTFHPGFCANAATVGELSGKTSRATWRRGPTVRSRRRQPGSQGLGGRGVCTVVGRAGMWGRGAAESRAINPASLTRHVFFIVIFPTLGRTPRADHAPRRHWSGRANVNRCNPGWIFSFLPGIMLHPLLIERSPVGVAQLNVWPVRNGNFFSSPVRPANPPSTKIASPLCFVDNLHGPTARRGNNPVRTKGRNRSPYHPVPR